MLLIWVCILFLRSSEISSQHSLLLLLFVQPLANAGIFRGMQPNSWWLSNRGSPCYKSLLNSNRKHRNSTKHFSCIFVTICCNMATGLFCYRIDNSINREINGRRLKIYLYIYMYIYYWIVCVIVFIERNSCLQS